MATNCSVRNNPLVRQTLKKLYMNKDNRGDITFIVESQSVRAHRCVLAALSPTFKDQFYKGHQNNSSFMNVTDTTASAFKEFLQFFYLERVTLTTENIRMVLELCKASQVDAFFNESISFLMETVNINNLCLSYHLAFVYDVKRLKELCETKISANTDKMFASRDFIECDRRVLINILKLDEFNCKEKDVFYACISWARAACKKKNIYAGNMGNLRTQLGDAIKEIRFASMTIEEFVTLHKANERFFTKDESIELMYIIGKLKDFKSKHFNQKERKKTNSIRAATPDSSSVDIQENWHWIEDNPMDIEQSQGSQICNSPYSISEGRTYDYDDEDVEESFLQYLADFGYK